MGLAFVPLSHMVAYTLCGLSQENTRKKRLSVTYSTCSELYELF